MRVRQVKYYFSLVSSHLLRRRVDSLDDALVVGATCQRHLLRRRRQLMRVRVEVACLLLKVAFAVRCACEKRITIFRVCHSTDSKLIF